MSWKVEFCSDLCKTNSAKMSAIIVGLLDVSQLLHCDPTIKEMADPLEIQIKLLRGGKTHRSQTHS